MCIDARAAHGALKQRHSKTDRGDAEGLARLAQTGWFKVVRLKSRASLERHALRVARERLVRIQRDLLSQVRGLVKPLGLVLPRTTPRRLTARIEAWLDEAPGMRPAIAALLAARTRIADELERLDRLLVRQAAADEATSLFATLSFWQGVDVPGRSLSLVTVDKLPFPRPDEPLLQARREQARAEAFATVDLPGLTRSRKVRSARPRSS